MAKIYFNNYGLELARAKIFNSLKSKKQIEIFDALELSSGDYLPKSKMQEGKHTVYGGGGATNSTHNEFNIAQRTLGIGRVGARCGCCFIIEPESWVTDNALFVSKLKYDYDYSFLMHYLNHVDLNKFANQSAQPVISQRGIANCTLPFINIEDQNKIASILDAIENGREFDDLYDLSSVLNVEKNLSILQDELSQQQTHLQQLRQAILQEAVQGKLTQQNAAEEPASTLLKRIKAEKQQLIAAGKLKKEKELPPITKDEIPFELPKGWVWCRLGEIINLVSGVTLGKTYREELIQVPYLRVANVQRGYVSITHIKELAVPKSEIDKYALKKGDLVMIEGGDWDKVGRCAIWNAEIEPCIHQNHIFRLRFYGNISNHWAELFLNSPVARRYFESCSKQTTNLASINKTQLTNLLFALPPLSIQETMVSKVRHLQQMTNQLEQQVAHSQSQAQQLLQAVLKEAFGGKVKAFEENEMITMAAEE